MSSRYNSSSHNRSEKALKMKYVQAMRNYLNPNYQSGGEDATDTNSQTTEKIDRIIFEEVEETEKKGGYSEMENRELYRMAQEQQNLRRQRGGQPELPSPGNLPQLPNRPSASGTKSSTSSFPPPAGNLPRSNAKQSPQKPFDSYFYRNPYDDPRYPPRSNTKQSPQKPFDSYFHRNPYDDPRYLPHSQPTAQSTSYGNHQYPSHSLPTAQPTSYDSRNRNTVSRESYSERSESTVPTPFKHASLASSTYTDQPNQAGGRDASPHLKLFQELVKTLKTSSKKYRANIDSKQLKHTQLMQVAKKIVDLVKQKLTPDAAKDVSKYHKEALEMARKQADEFIHDTFPNLNKGGSSQSRPKSQYNRRKMRGGQSTDSNLESYNNVFELPDYALQANDDANVDDMGNPDLIGDFTAGDDPEYDALGGQDDDDGDNVYDDDDEEDDDRLDIAGGEDDHDALGGNDTEYRLTTDVASNHHQGKYLY